MPRNATTFQKKVIKFWLNQKISDIQQGNTQNAGTQIYNVLMMTDPELAIAVQGYANTYIADFLSQADNLDAAAQQARDEAAGFTDDT